MSAIVYFPIGYIFTPFKDASGMPIQSNLAGGTKGHIEILPEYESALMDLEKFSHIMVFYHFHRSRKVTLQVTPFLDDKTHGLFATRAPSRPNAIGISIVKLSQIKGLTLFVENVDMLNNTPVLDIKPYIPDFDIPNAKDRIKTGWYHLKKADNPAYKSDKRFTKDN